MKLKNKLFQISYTRTKRLRWFNRMSVGGLVFMTLALVGIGTVVAQIALDPPDDIFDNGYTYRRPITIDNTQVDATVTDFPVYVGGTYSYLATVVNGGKLESVDGYDIIFTTDSAGLNELDYEVEKHDLTTGEFASWVKVPSVSDVSDTTIYMFYGNSSITASQESVTDTWSNSYEAVWHLDDVEAVPTTLGETGTITINDSLDWETVTLLNDYNTDPVILATPVTAANCEQGACSGNNSTGGLYPVPVVRNVTSDTFEISMCVDGGAATCDTSVLAETFHWFAFDPDEAANYNWIEVGTTASVATDGSNTSGTFSGTMSGVPAVWTQAQTYSQGGEIGAVAWVNDNQTTTGFTYIGCVHTGTGDNCDGTASSETFGYVAIDVSAADFVSSNGFQSSSANISNSLWTSAIFSPSYSAPRVMVTQNDDNGVQDPQYAWARTVGVSGMEFRYCEQDNATTCNTHTGEVTNWFAFEDGIITANGASTIDKVLDSTINNNDGFPFGGLSSSDVAAGQTGDGLNFDGSGDYVDIGLPASLDFTTEFSICAWFNPDVDNVFQPLLSKGDTQYILKAASSDSYEYKAGNQFFTADSVDIGSWQHICGVFTGSDTDMYVNGTFYNGVSVASITSDAFDVLIGANDEQAGRFADGVIDSIQVASSQRSSGWFTTTYNNQSNPSSFYTIGSEIVSGAAIATDIKLGRLQGKLVGHWDFDDDIDDRTPYEHNGIAVGTPAPTTDRNSQSNQAYSFDGAGDYIAIGDKFYDQASQITETTVCAWVNSSSSSNQIIASFDRNEYWRLALKDDQGTGNIGWDTNSPTGGTHDMSTTTDYADGQWHHVCGWFDSDAVPSKRIYVDGLSVESSTPHGGDGIGSGTTRYGFIGIGSEADSENGTTGPNDYMNGVLDDVRLYERALSEDEINDLYDGYDSKIQISNLSKQLVGHWSLNGDASDRTPYSNSGTVNGATVSTDRNGQSGRAYSFDGNDYIQTSTDNLPTGDFTYSAWINFSDVSDGAIFMSADNAGGNELLIRVFGGQVNTFIDNADILTNGTISAGTWHHVVILRSGSTLTHYIDNVSAGSTTAGNTLDFESCGLIFGADVDTSCTGGYSNFANGTIDDARVYDRALSTGDIEALYETYYR